MLPNVGFFEELGGGGRRFDSNEVFLFIQNNLKVCEKKFQFRYITKKKIPQPRKCHASASRVFSFFAQRYLHNLRLILHVITTMATTKTQTGLPTK